MGWLTLGVAILAIVVWVIVAVAIHLSRKKAWADLCESPPSGMDRLWWSAVRPPRVFSTHTRMPTGFFYRGIRPGPPSLYF